MHVGVVKTYKLTYEAVEVQHALFDKSRAQNQWTIESRFLREIIDHFGPTSEQLDIHSENNRVNFTSFTQKVTNGKGEGTGTAFLGPVGSLTYPLLGRNPEAASTYISCD